jgi:hypothetical protein
LVTLPVMVVLPELIANGIESVSVLEICTDPETLTIRAATLTLAGFSVNVRDSSSFGGDFGGLGGRSLV